MPGNKTDLFELLRHYKAFLVWYDKILHTIKLHAILFLQNMFLFWMDRP